MAQNIDFNPLEMEAFQCCARGNIREGHRLEDAFLRQIEGANEDHCPCPEACRLHGKCKQCVLVHRGHGDHFPYCFWKMFNKRLLALSGMSEHSMLKDTGIQPTDKE